MDQKLFFLPLKEIILRVTSPKVPHYRIMVIISSLSWDLAPPVSAWDFCLPVEPCHLPLSITPDVCFASQLVRCIYGSFRELILSCSIFEKIDPSRVSFPLVVMSVGVPGARLRDNDGDRINNLMKCNLDREDYTSCVYPSPYPTLESRDEILV